MSIHSNHQAPSRDIAIGFSHANRIRHLLSGGKFIVGSFDYQKTKKDFETSPDYHNLFSLDNLREVGPAVKSLVLNDQYLQKVFAMGKVSKSGAGFKVDKSKTKLKWKQTLASSYINSNQLQIAQLTNVVFKAGKSFSLQNGDFCKLFNWILVQSREKVVIGQVIEILQIQQSSAELENRPNFILVSIFETTLASEVYGMPRLIECGTFGLAQYEVSQ